MRLSKVIDRVIDAIQERIRPEDELQVQFLRGMSKQLIHHLGDIELNIDIRRVPAETEHVEGKEE